MCGSEIVLLAAVLAQVVEFPRPGWAGCNEFPITHADGPVVVVIEVEKLMRSGAVLAQRGCNAPAGKRRPAFGGDAAARQNRLQTLELSAR